jgi:hypothetical protein
MCSIPAVFIPSLGCYKHATDGGAVILLGITQRRCGFYGCGGARKSRVCIFFPRWSSCQASIQGNGSTQSQLAKGCLGGQSNEEEEKSFPSATERLGGYIVWFHTEWTIYLSIVLR